MIFWLSLCENMATLNYVVITCQLTIRTVGYIHKQNFIILRDIQEGFEFTIYNTVVIWELWITISGCIKRLPANGFQWAIATFQRNLVWKGILRISWNRKSCLSIKCYQNSLKDSLIAVFWIAIFVHVSIVLLHRRIHTHIHFTLPFTYCDIVVVSNANTLL